MNILDLVFPKYCINCRKIGDFICSNCFSFISFETKNICLVCGKPSYDGLTHPICKSKFSIEGSFTGVVYNKVPKKLLYQFKYKPYVSALSSLVVNLLYESLIQNEEFMAVLKTKPILAPIPLSNRKFKKRGYNQAEIIVKGLSKKLNLETFNLLERVKDTKTQVGLNKEGRRKNIEGAFSVKIKNQKINLKNIILVDDVLTTGSTFSEACKVLKKNDAGRIWAVAFAKED